MKRRTLRRRQAKRYKFPDKSVKILKEGQECRHCDGKVVRAKHKPGWVPKPDQPYYFEYWFKCPNCKALFMVEEARRYQRAAKPDPGEELDQALAANGVYWYPER